jgi:cobalamin biosynthesis Mg chelatase CobN
MSSANSKFSHVTVGSFSDSKEAAPDTDDDEVIEVGFTGPVADGNPDEPAEDDDDAVSEVGATIEPADVKTLAPGVAEDDTGDADESAASHRSASASADDSGKRHRGAGRRRAADGSASEARTGEGRGDRPAEPDVEEREAALRSKMPTTQKIVLIVAVVLIVLCALYVLDYWGVVPTGFSHLIDEGSKLLS